MAITVSISLVGVVLWGTLSGSLLPFLLRRLGFDPATSSAPFVATLVDVTGLVIYFSVALVVSQGDSFVEARLQPRLQADLKVRLYVRRGRSLDRPGKSDD